MPTTTPSRPPDEPCIALARRHDPDRFLCAMLAPPEARPDLCVLISFNHELVRAVELPSARSGAGPIASLIRLQWWREVVENSRGDWHGHEVAAPLRRLLDAMPALAATLGRLVAAREAEAEGPDTVEGWRTALLEGAGGVQRAMAERLGLDPAVMERIAAAGAAYGCGAGRRHLGALLRAGRCPVPDAMLQVPEPGRAAALQAVLTAEGRAFVAAAGGFRLGRGRIAPALPLVLARRDLARQADAPAGARGLGDRLAVLAAGLLGRVGQS